MPKPILTPEAKAALVGELRQAAQEYRRVCPRSLAAKYGISPNSVRTFGSKYGIPVRSTTSPENRQIVTREDRLRAHASPLRTMRDLELMSGMDYITIKATIRYAKLAGRPIPYLRTPNKKSGIVELLEPMPHHIVQWLIANVPKGGTVHELITAIIVDAYNEEH